jgi:hypothetical protein
MMSGRGCALVAALVLTISACGGGDDAGDDASGDDPTETVAAVEEGQVDYDGPPILVSNGEWVARLADGRITKVAELGVPVGLAFGDGAGGVIVQELSDDQLRLPTLVRAVRAGRDEPVETVKADAVQLYDVVLVDGEPNLLYGAMVDSEEGSGPIVMQSLGSNHRRVLGDAFGIEYSVIAASAARGTIVTSAYADLTEAFRFTDLDGAPVEGWFNASQSLPYNGPPRLINAMLSPAGDRLAYLSGPDFDGLAESPDLVGSWEVVVQTKDGDELVRIGLGGRELEVVSLDFDGRWVVMSIGGHDEPRGAAILIDTTAPSPLAIRLPVAGWATFETPGSAG